MQETGSSERTEKYRMTLDLTPAMKRELEAIAALAGTTQADVLRQALGLYKTVKQAQAQGEQPALIDKEGHVTARLVGI